ncbi:hypothetical protein AB0O31_21590 [Kitasatospora cineracea]|uniref:hypothetical protein n=1 Tax=Kitasatospora cineracea TaxID=88074 RepID=UPI003436E28C
MLHRRLIASAAVLAASVAFLPGAAHAADPAPNAGQALAPRDWEPSGAKTFTSPAAESHRMPKAAALAAQAPAAGTGRTIYTTVAENCAADHGTGAQATPFCNLQHAVDAAAPGDTVLVAATVNSNQQTSSSAESVTIRTSGLTITGTVNRPAVSAYGDLAGKPALVLDGVSDVKITNLQLNAAMDATAVVVKGSTRVTLDSGHVRSNPEGSGISVDGASSAVKVTRTYVSSASWSTSADTSISVAAGAKDVTLAGNLLAGSRIAATGVQGLNVTGNTLQRGCAGALSVDGASTGVSVRNNLVVESPTLTCGAGQAPVQVSAEAAAGTTADHNDFALASDTAGPYAWAGTLHPTLGAFRTATGQGAHDTLEAVRPQGVGTGIDVGVAYALQPGSTAIGSADQSAPGALTTDFFGSGPMTDRGAVKYLSTNPTLSVALTATSSSAYGITLKTNVTTRPVSQYAYVYWGDSTADSFNSVGSQPVQISGTHVYPKLGDYTVTVVLTDNDGNTVSNAVKVSTLGSQYTAYGPKRLLDSRDGTGVPAKGRIAPYGTVKLKIGGANGIPANATAAVLNVTVTNPTAGGHITAYPHGGAQPTTSNVNYQAGQTVPNLVMVPIGTDGYVDLYNGGWGPTDLIADITGYFTPAPAAGYASSDPRRLVDTRDGTGAPRAQVAGRSSIPVRIGSGVTAVALNVTVTNPREDGHLIVYPSGQAVPTASNVNFKAGQTIANAVVVPVGADGSIRVFNGAWAGTDVIVDVVGYYRTDTAAAFIPVDPERLLDTRDPALWKGALPLAGRYYAYLPLTTRTDIPAFVFNATVTNTRDDGHLSVAADPNTLDNYKNKNPYSVSAPATSSLNWKRGDTVPNLVQVLSTHGIVDFFNESDGNIDLIVDIFGYYQNG